MQTSDLWSSLQTSLFIQRVYCLSPFYLHENNNRLHAPWTTVVYTGVYLVAYTSIIAISVYHFDVVVYLKEFLPIGFLWLALSGLEFVLTNATFIVVIVVLTVKRGAQMEFLHRTATVDDRLRRHFGAQLDLGQLKRGNRLAWLVMSLYYQGLAIVVAVAVYRTHHSQLLPIVFAYQLEQATASGLAFLLVNYMLILRSRFVLVRRIAAQARLEYTHAKRSRQKDAVLRRLTAVFEVFKELCDLVGVYERAFGLVALVRLGHDFTLLNTQLYLLFWLARDAANIDDLWYIGVALVWMLPNVAKIGCTTATVESALGEANETKRQLQNVERIVDAEDRIELLDHFFMWGQHQDLCFSAHHFFNVDNTLAYTIIGAMTSYLLILVQFKLQEESFISGQNGGNSTTVEA